MTGNHFYSQDGTALLPNPPAQSPWNPRHQSGVAIAGLLMHALEGLPAHRPMQLTRFTLDILRPAPMAPVEVHAAVTRDGSRIQNLVAEIRADGEPVARALGVRVRIADTPSAGPRISPDVSLAQSPDRPLVRRDPNRSGVETRLIRGGLVQSGPGAAWIRPSSELLLGLDASPMVAAAMASDLGLGLSAVFDSRKWSFANVDLAIHFIRPPRTAWVHLAAETNALGNGLALVDSVLCDEEGEFARAHQTLFIDALPSTAAGEAKKQVTA